jgi:hypothetical protein
MHALLSWRVFWAAFFAGSIAACAFHPQRGSGAALVGAWKNSMGTVWLLRDDGTFDVDLDRDGKRDSWGKYKVDGDRVSLMRKGGYAPKNCRGKGVYRFNRATDDTLQFTLVKDDCNLRIKNVTSGWKRK